MHLDGAPGSIEFWFYVSWMERCNSLDREGTAECLSVYGDCKWVAPETPWSTMIMQVFKALLISGSDTQGWDCLEPA